MRSGGRLDNVTHVLRALKGRNYALFFFGHGSSLIGTWMQNVALPVLVWKLYPQEWMLGLLGFSAQIFGFLIAPLAGVFSDRIDRRRLLLATQSLAMLQATLLAVLTFTQMIEVWHIVVLAMTGGLIIAFDIPARQSFVVDLVDRKEDLPNAIALNSMIFNLARMVGPVVAAGVMTAAASFLSFRYAGEGMCFAVNALTYVAILAALLLMRTRPTAPRTSVPRVLHSLREGFGYSMGHGPIRAILLLLACVGVAAMPYGTLLPAVAAKTLLGGRHEALVALPLLGGVTLTLEQTMGALVSSAGAGALLGALYLASRRTVHGLKTVMAVAALTAGLGIVGVSLSTQVWLSCVMLFLIGVGLMATMASANTVIQTIVDPDKRGRVMSFYTMAFLGTSPFGALLAGAVAQRWGAPAALGVLGACTIAAAGWFAWRLPRLREQVRPVYVRLGILSDAPPIPRTAVEEDIEDPADARPQ